MMLVVSPDAVIVPIGGGGLIAGIAAYFKQNPATSGTTNVIGVQPANDAAMWASIEAGHIVDIAGKDTLSDATAGGIEREDNITFELTKRYVFDRPLVVLLTHACI
jgi:threonine dehydratase